MKDIFLVHDLYPLTTSWRLTSFLKGKLSLSILNYSMYFRRYLNGQYTRCAERFYKMSSAILRNIVWNAFEVINPPVPGVLKIVIFELDMMTSWNGNIFRVTGHLCGEFTGHRWSPHTKASDAEHDIFFDLRLNKRMSKQSRDWWFETSSRSLWRHCNVEQFLWICPDIN